MARKGCREWLQVFKTALPGSGRRDSDGRLAARRLRSRPADARTQLLKLIVDGDDGASEHVGRGTDSGPFGNS